VFLIIVIYHFRACCYSELGHTITVVFLFFVAVW